jgi:hypothetical protein
MQPDQRISRLELVSLANAADLAGLHTRDVLRRWNWPGPLDIAWIVVAELVNSALARPVPIPSQLNHPMLDAARPLRLTLQWAGGPLSIELWDSDPTPSQIWATHPQHQGGRGLALVAAYCNRWSYHFPPEGGKVLWCELTATPALPAAPPPRALESSQPPSGQWAGPRQPMAQPLPPPMGPPPGPPNGAPNGWTQNGYAADGHPQDGWSQNGYPPNGQAQNGHAPNGWSQNGQQQDGYPPNGQAQNGYAQNGQQQDGYAQNGYPQNGYGQNGWTQDDRAPESPPTGNPGDHSQPVPGYQGR